MRDTKPRAFLLGRQREMNVMPVCTIGIMDSGRGADAVASAVLQQLASLHVKVIVFRDRAYFPYGLLTRDQLIRRVHYGMDYLIKKGADVIICACHTASVVALKHVKMPEDVVVIDMMEPSLQAVMRAEVDHVYWLATKATSLAFSLMLDALRKKGYHGECHPVICQEWVSAIERDKPNKPFIEKTMQGFLDQTPLPNKRQGVFLGCTHFSHWQHAIRSCLPDDLVIIDPTSGLVDVVRAAITEV